VSEQDFLELVEDGDSDDVAEVVLRPDEDAEERLPEASVTSADDEPKESLDALYISARSGTERWVQWPGMRTGCEALIRPMEGNSLWDKLWASFHEKYGNKNATKAKKMASDLIRWASPRIYAQTIFAGIRGPWAVGSPVKTGISVLTMRQGEKRPTRQDKTIIFEIDATGYLCNTEANRISMMQVWPKIADVALELASDSELFNIEASEDIAKN
jgi:hypothetical protein